MTINQALNRAMQKLQKNKITIPHLDAEVLLSRILKKPREFLLAHPDFEVKRSDVTRYALCVTRRTRGEPIAYITGRKEFYGLDFFVNKNVLIPRSETEMIVEEAVKHATRNMKHTTFIDIGTGSGCVIISLIKEIASSRSNLGYPRFDLGGFKFFGIDISRPALTVARKNAKLHGLEKRIKFLYGNLLEPIIKKSKTLEIRNYNLVILANLPYLTPAQVKNSPTIQYEPKLALTAGPDGLKYYKKLFEQIKTLKTLCVPRYALCEIDPSQTTKIKQLIKKELPNAKVEIKKDPAGRNRLAMINF